MKGEYSHLGVFFSREFSRDDNTFAEDGAQSNTTANMSIVLLLQRYPQLYKLYVFTKRRFAVHVRVSLRRRFQVHLLRLHMVKYLGRYLNT